MEIKNVNEEIRKKLKEPLNPKALSQHPTKPYLTTIKAIYVVERLNDVFGIGKWYVKNEVISTKESMIVVYSTLTIPEYAIEISNFGGNDNGGEGSKNFDLGDAYKGACTDALTKICSYLEIGIDVFKGQNKPANTQPQQTTTTPQATSENKPTKWLNKDTPEFTKVKEYIAGGGNVTEVRKKYMVSKEVEKLLNEVL